MLRQFWANVRSTKHGCWEWTGRLEKGYGRFGIDRRDWGAHRFIYAMAYGPIPPGMLVCHSCNLRRCVKLTHLFLDTPAGSRMNTIIKCRSRFTKPIRCIDIPALDIDQPEIDLWPYRGELTPYEF